MFTGIVETTAPVLERTDVRLTITRPTSFMGSTEPVLSLTKDSPHVVSLGNSISVNGVCLTVVDLQKDSISFDVVGETWRRTNLGDLFVGNTVNLERALPANGRFEGHIVQGHIEGTAIVKEWKDDGQWKQLLLQMPDAVLPFIVEKGSIALDGVSLTVAGLAGNVVTIALIPHTLEITTLGLRKPGDKINVETDILAHYLLKNQS